MPESPSSTPWTLAPADDGAVRALAAAAGVSEVVARVLLLRGVGDATAVHRFLTPDLARDWRDPEEIPGMPACADMVAEAVRAGTRIVVFGDFDVDGLTAAAVASRGLAAMGADVLPFVPHRFDEGYGLSGPAVERVLAMRPGLVVTVDCGISSAAEVELFRAAGVDVVVTDHHEPGDGLPVGVPVCDPKLGPVAFDGLAGAGVALKLVAAVGARLGMPDVWCDLTDLAALGTIADVVPLIDENRAIVADGLARMRRAPRAGVAALCHVASVDGETVTSEKVAFFLAPRLNAAGRIADPAEALDLLMTDDPARADTRAAALDEYNRIRQGVEAELTEAASRQAEETWIDGMRALVLAGEGWHEGVKGIVAARIAGRYGVPTLLFCIEDGEARGSGRSVGSVDLHGAVSQCSELLTRFGGHAAAVGVTLPASALERFAECLRGALEAVPDEAFASELVVDAIVHLPDADRELAAQLAALEPFGSGNARPLLAAPGVFMTGRKRVGQQQNHLKFEAYDGVTSLPAIAFRCADIEMAAHREEAVDLAFNLETDSWQGRERVQLQVRRIAPHASGDRAAAAELVEELFADAERILARGEYEGIGDAEAFHTKLAGVTFEGRQDVVGRLVPGTPLHVARQPANEFDPNAIALFDPAGDQVGFFNRRLAAVLAPLLDGGAAWTVSVADVTGGDDASRGVNVIVERAGAAEQAEVEEEDRLARRAELAALSASDLDVELTRALIGERSLHDAQTASLAHLAAGRSCLTVMATGRGKSLIFHLHAARIALARGEASVFVYPLRALVADQAFHLEESFASLGLRVTLVTGETSPAGRDAVFAALADGSVDALMTTPEFLERHAGRFAESGRARFVVVDEAHHVGLARAGHRPAYARLGEALAALGGPVVCAVTATASADVAALIRSTLGIDEVVLDPTRRDNLGVADRRGLADKVAHLASVASRGEKLIVYVNSREQSVRIAERLRDSSPRLRERTAFYNGGMARAARHAVEHAFREGEITAVVATSAFGEGVNIPDVRHVGLFHLPFNRVEFNQMCGRAGRDGEPATVHLLFGERDGRLNELILESGAPDLDDLRTLYVVLRERAAAGADGWIEVTNADLAEDVKQRRPKARLSDKGVSTGVGIFRELGFVTGEGSGAYRRLALLPVEGKTELTSSIRYAEGVEEAEEFSAFRHWVLTSSADELRCAFDRPILPDGGIRGTDSGSVLQ
ncbi:MAG: single-stranded-DNA-specific exonuclease RecJ [Coriobacteriia bacterium]|nr:single-stranded-DNA-specific exonuclease RecJ [Coriobacteriia bacterium]